MDQEYRWFPWMALATALILSAYYYFNVSGQWMLDDSFISFRYAENWADGYGPVYNPGEDPVEGYTTFLWVAILAIGHWLGADTVILAKTLGISWAIILLILLANAHRFVPSLSPLVSAFAVFFMSTFCIVHPWPASGMETSLFGMMILLSFLLHFRTLDGEGHSRTRLLLGIVLALTSMTRPEGALVAGLILSDQVVECLYRRRCQLLYALVPFLAIVLPWFLWRYWYYGYPVPNTFYAKVGASNAQLHRGLAYLLTFAPLTIPMIFPAVLAVLIPPAWRRRYGRFYLLPLFLAVYTAYVVAVGGDGLPAFRFLAAPAALFCLIAAVGVRRICYFAPLATIVAVAISLCNIYQMFHDPMTYAIVKNEDAVCCSGTIVGKWLRENAAPEAVIALNTAGTIPYYSKLRAIDMLGLNDEHIAHREIPNMGARFAGHEKGDGAYVLDRKPDYIQFGSASGRETPRSFISDREIYANPVFKRDYELKRYVLPNGVRLTIYERKKDLAAGPDNSGVSTPQN